MIGKPPLELGTIQLSVTRPEPATPFSERGGDGTVACGVAAAAAAGSVAYCLHHATIIHVPAGVAHNLGVAAQLEGVKDHARRLGHDGLHVGDRCVELLERSLDEDGVMHWRTHFDAALCCH